MCVVGSFDSIVDGLILNARISAPVHAECTRCLKPIQRDWTVNVTSFFPYEDKSANVASGKGGKNGKNGKEEEVDIIAGEDEAEDVPAARRRRLGRPRGAAARHAGRGTAAAAVVQAGLQGPVLAVRHRPERGTPDHHHDMTDIRFAALEGLKAKLEGKDCEGRWVLCGCGWCIVCTELKLRY